MEIFIEEIRNHECLWNPTSPDYKDCDRRIASWRAVIRRTGIDNIKTAKSTWKKLRDNHREALKRQKDGKNGQVSKSRRLWRYQKVMEFIVPYMRYRKTSDDYSQEDFQMLQCECENQDSSDELTEVNEDDTEEKKFKQEVYGNSHSCNSTSTHNSDNNTQNSCTLFERQKNMQQIDKHSYFVKNEKIECEKNTDHDIKNQADKFDEVDHFFLSMCESVKKLQRPAQIRLKKKIFDLVAEEEEYSVYNNILYASPSDHKKPDPLL